MIQFKKKQLVKVIEYLEDVSLIPKISRLRTRLLNRLRSKVEEFYNDELELLDKYGKKDDGKLIQKEGAFELVEETALEYHQEKEVLLEEVVSINIDEIQLSELIFALEESEEKLSGESAEILDVLLTALEREEKK